MPVSALLIKENWHFYFVILVHFSVFEFELNVFRNRVCFVYDSIIIYVFDMCQYIYHLRDILCMYFFCLCMFIFCLKFIYFFLFCWNQLRYSFDSSNLNWVVFNFKNYHFINCRSGKKVRKQWRLWLEILNIRWYITQV